MNNDNVALVNRDAMRESFDAVLVRIVHNHEVIPLQPFTLQPVIGSGMLLRTRRSKGMDRAALTQHKHSDACPEKLQTRRTQAEVVGCPASIRAAYDPAAEVVLPHYSMPAAARHLKMHERSAVHLACSLLASTKQVYIF